MFKVACTADDEAFEMAFVPKQDSLSSAETWMSTDGTIVVQRGALGWAAYRYPSWEKLKHYGILGTKELAAFAACKAWVN